MVHLYLSEEDARLLLRFCDGRSIREARMLSERPRVAQALRVAMAETSGIPRRED